MSQPVFAITSPDLLVATIPHLMGFVPEDSVVAVLTDPDDRIVVTIRVDVPDMADLSHWTRDFAERCAPVAATGALTANVVTFTSHPGTPAPLDAARAAASALTVAGVQVADQLTVTGRAWARAPWAILGQAAAHSGVLTDAALAQVSEAFGGDPCTTREDAIRDFLPDPDAVLALTEALEGQAPAVLESPSQVEACVAELGDLLCSPEDIPLPSAARLILALADLRVRDTLMHDLLVSPKAAVEQARDHLTTLVRAVPPGRKAPLLSLTASLFFLTGEGVAVRALLESAIEDDPRYSLARMMLEVYERGIPPRDWIDGVRGIPRQELLSPGLP